MSFPQIKRATQDAKSFQDFGERKLLTAPRYVLVPSLGAIGILDDHARLGLITFYVVPYDSSVTIPGLLVTRPFLGKLDDLLSFERGPVHKAQVEAAFGKVQEGISNSGVSRSYVSVDSIRKEDPFFVRRGDEETLYYPRLGLSFRLKGDVVNSFGVSKPAKSDAKE